MIGISTGCSEENTIATFASSGNITPGSNYPNGDCFPGGYVWLTGDETKICDYTNSTAGKFMGSIQFTFNGSNYNVVELNGQTGSVARVHLEVCFKVQQMLAIDFALKEVI